MPPTPARQPTGGYLERPRPSGLADVIEVILDKGLVIDAYVRVALVGIEILTIDARIVVASVDTYLRFAEAVNRLDLTENDDADVTDLLGGGAQRGAAKAVTKGAIEGVKEELGFGRRS
jgi:gas vesicle structural protein